MRLHGISSTVFDSVRQCSTVLDSWQLSTASTVLDSARQFDSSFDSFDSFDSQGSENLELVADDRDVRAVEQRDEPDGSFVASKLV